MKIFTTQLIGRIKKIESDEVYSIEDAARLLTQALVGQGSIYIYAKNEMEGVLAEVLHGQERIGSAKILTDDNMSELTEVDRVLMFSRLANDEDTLKVGKLLHNKGIPFVVVGSIGTKEENPIEDLSHVFINLYMDKGLVPTLTGDRIGYPSLIAALYVYHNIKLLIDEMLEDFA